ncbi:NUDIX hydrolase [Entomobacter blattae]|uniref:NrtR DNA-binding winged helix domain-containing protein n=1 Tax=Entomobacter blattae TaxID=2762277 RepID=A0A7H1NQD7_9PROT|nr:hypothetical protein [Entomobacter blattae]QNT77997.1 hypothetical protein JGUZn3_07640 [Entomobacter blattae]
MGEVSVSLVAVLLAVSEETPLVLTLQGSRLLPSGPLEEQLYSLQAGMRQWVERQTGHKLGHIEQLYTFYSPSDHYSHHCNSHGNDHDTHQHGSGVGNLAGSSSILASYLESAGEVGQNKAQLSELQQSKSAERTSLIMVSYLALTRIRKSEKGWQSWYAFFPWEDQTTKMGQEILRLVCEKLELWLNTYHANDSALYQRYCLTMGQYGLLWDDELVLQRYELLYEAGLIEESCFKRDGETLVPGLAMDFDHRRILATGIARLRVKIRYRPVVFELMPKVFTLLDLQNVVEKVAGRKIHKQNFRRLLTQQSLVEETGESVQKSKGRPAKLFRFKREVVDLRQVSGTKLPILKSRL